MSALVPIPARVPIGMDGNGRPVYVERAWLDYFNVALFQRVGGITGLTFADILGAAPLASPTFTGIPKAPTAAALTNTTQLATTAFVDAVRLILVAADALNAPLASPGLTGTPTAPTAAIDTNTTQLSTTAFMLAQASAVSPLMDNVVAIGTSTRYARADHVHPVDTSRAAAALEAFIAPTFLNSWVNFDATTFNAAGYYKDGFGIVHLRGLVKTGTVALAIFTLPAGYRPVKTELFSVVSNNAFGRVDVDTGGNVILTIGSNAFASLDGITFRAA